MCDLGPVSASLGLGSPGETVVNPGAIKPMAKPQFNEPAGFSTGELLGQAGGVLSAFGGASEADDMAAQRERRAGQILEATKQTIALKALQQGRDRGQTVARIGRAGVGMSGSAAVLIDQQDRLDEMALEADKQRGVLQIEGEMAEAATAKTKSRVGLAKGLQLGAELAGNFKGFDLG